MASDLRLIPSVYVESGVNIPEAIPVLEIKDLY